MGGSVAWGEDEENRKEKMDGKGVGDADPRQRRKEVLFPPRAI